jgi:asparagine synthase (glutamine-hydrolysing)
MGFVGGGSGGLRGADDSTVRQAIAEHDPLPGTAGFAGELDGRLVRDVLGRQPLFYESFDGDESQTLPPWSFDPTDLTDPVVLPAGHVLDAGAEVAPTSSESHQQWSLPAPDPTDDDTALDAVRGAVLESVRDQPSDSLAVAFSGGVDSAIVAAGVPEAPCYVAGFEDCHDVAAARDAAEAMARDLRVVEFTHDDIVRAVPEIVRATGRTNAMDVQIALPLYFAAEAAAADGFEHLAVGQGADELFGGYRKVVDPASDHRVEADTVRGATREVVSTLPDQLSRDVLTLRAAGVEPVAPLLHDRVVEAALSLPATLLATERERKIALRRAATGVVPDQIRDAEKKAAQYGTYAARELDRLARQAGYKRRMDDHVQRYVESLVAESD